MDRYKIIRYFAYTIEILILYMVQETPGLLPEIGGARPVLLIPAAISIAMFESELAGIAFGLLCGLFLDIGMGGVLGFHGLLLAAACYGVGLLTADLIQTNFLTSQKVCDINLLESSTCLVKSLNNGFNLRHLVTFDTQLITHLQDTFIF